MGGGRSEGREPVVGVAAIRAESERQWGRVQGAWR
jgi:hypothetical protein